MEAVKFMIEIRVKLKRMDEEFIYELGEHLKDLMLDDQDNMDTISDITYEVKEMKGDK